MLVTLAHFLQHDYFDAQTATLGLGTGSKHRLAPCKSIARIYAKADSDHKDMGTGARDGGQLGLLPQIDRLARRGGPVGGVGAASGLVQGARVEKYVCARPGGDVWNDAGRTWPWAWSWRWFWPWLR